MKPAPGLYIVNLHCLHESHLEIIINIKIKNQKIKKTKTKIDFFNNTKNGGCPLIRACSLIRSNTVII